MYTVYMHKFPNGKVYIGITRQDVKRRWRNGKGYEGQVVFDAILKYGWDNIEHIILETNLTREQAENAERFYIHKYNSLSHENGYNVEKGGYVTEIVSIETKEKISKANKGKFAGSNHWNYGKHWDDKTKQKISNSHKGMKYGETTLQKKRERFKGKNNPMYGTKLTPEHKSKLQKACIDAKSKAVVCIETNMIYKSGAEAEKETGICARLINYVCKGQGYYKTAGGYHWKFKEEAI